MISADSHRGLTGARARPVFRGTEGHESIAYWQHIGGSLWNTDFLSPVMSTHRDCDSLTGNRLAIVISIWLTYFTYLQTSHRYTSKQIDLLLGTASTVLRTIRRSVSRSVLQSLVSSLVLAAGLRQYDTRRRFITSLVTAAVSDERRRTTYLFLIKVPAHHSAPSSAALRSGLHSNMLSSSTSVYTGPHLHITDEL